MKFINFLGELAFWILIMSYVSSCSTKPPSDLDKTDSNYIQKKLDTEKIIIKSELQDIDYRLRNSLFSSKNPEQEKTDLIRLQKEKKDQLDRLIWEEELRKKEKDK